MKMDTAAKLEIMKSIDEYIETERPKQPGEKDTTIMMPLVEKIAAEYEMDVTDLFVAYMDHIAISNKRIAQEAEEEMDFSKIKRFY